MSKIRDIANIFSISTGIATDVEVTTAINGVIDGAPSDLNTLNKLAAAINDDPNFYLTAGSGGEAEILTLAGAL
jgi:hypothetical protein